MADMVREIMPLRSVILGTLVVCLLVAVAPWLSGGQEPLAMVVSAGGLLLGTLLVWRQLEARWLRRGPLLLAWGLFLGFAALSLAWSANRYSTGLWLTQWAMAGLAFGLAYTVAGESRGRQWLVTGYLASAVGFAAVAIWMYLTGSYDRLTGTFYWPNPAAAYLMPAIILSVDRWRQGLNKKTNWWYAASVILLAAFWLTDSRGALIVLAPVTALYLLVVATPRRFWITFVFNIVLAAALSLGLMSLSTLITHHGTKTVPGARLAEAAKGESMSWRDRVYFVQSAFEIWWAHPVGGAGAGTYGDVHPQHQQRAISASTNAHNEYAQILAELGLVGAALLAGVMLWLIVGVARGFATAPQTLPLVLGAGALALHFGLDIDAAYPALLMLLAVLFGLVYRQRREVRAGGPWWPVVLAVAVLVPAVSLFQSDTWAKRADAAQSDGDLELAADDYSRAHTGVLYDPDYVSAEGIDWYSLGLSGSPAAKDQLERALSRAREAQRLDPRDGQHHQLEGRVLAAQGRSREAQAALRRALSLDPHNHPDYALDLARLQLAAGDEAGALQTARAMIGQYPDEVVANRHSDATVAPAVANLRVLVGNAELAAGRTSAAEQQARQALRLQPGNLRARALLHQVEERKRTVETAG